jgi:hyaluronan synthase/N-acetylglucosaminyltransferase
MTINGLHLIAQTIYSFFYLTKPAPLFRWNNQTVLVVIPSFKESYINSVNTILSCLVAIESIDGHIIYAEDDESINPDLIAKFKDESRLLFWCNGINLGKRETQVNAWNHYLQTLGRIPDYLVTVDSDTVLHNRAIVSLIARLESNSKVGAVTGNVSIIHKKNLLQRMISLRYFLAFNQERAAQALHGQVLCCSGPLTAYQGWLFSRLKKEYVNQTWKGIKCTFGDDRHLTNLVIRSGFKTQYAPEAICFTDCPNTFRHYFKQQLRWTKSFFREAWIMLHYKTLTFYTYWEVMVAVVLPLMLMLNVIWLLIRSTQNIFILIDYAFIVIVMAWLRSLFGLIFDGLNNKKDYFYYPAFAFVSLVLLIPIRVKALLSLSNNKWGTR